MSYCIMFWDTYCQTKIVWCRWKAENIFVHNIIQFDEKLTDFSFYSVSLFITAFSIHRVLFSCDRQTKNG